MTSPSRDIVKSVTKKAAKYTRLEIVYTIARQYNADGNKWVVSPCGIFVSFVFFVVDNKGLTTKTRRTQEKKPISYRLQYITVSTQLPPLSCKDQHLHQQKRHNNLKTQKV